MNDIELRDYFAAKAMQALITIAETRGWQYHTKEAAMATIASKAFILADAMVEGGRIVPSDI